MDKETYMILGIVGSLIIIGTVLSLPKLYYGSITGNAVYETESCSDQVCAAVGNRLVTFSSDCKAKEAGARIVYENRCEAIPIANSEK